MPKKKFIVIAEKDGKELGRHRHRHDADNQVASLMATGVKAQVIREGCCG